MNKDSVKFRTRQDFADMDGIQVFARGFNTIENGQLLVERLSNLGFDVKPEVFTGRDDSLGGLVETYPTLTGGIDPSTVEDIENVLFGDGTPGFLQYRTWRIVDDVDTSDDR